jgi:hypothetical protein
LDCFFLFCKQRTTQNNDFSANELENELGEARARLHPVAVAAATFSVPINNQSAHLSVARIFLNNPVSAVWICVRVPKSKSAGMQSRAAFEERFNSSSVKFALFIPHAAQMSAALNKERTRR